MNDVIKRLSNLEYIFSFNSYEGLIKQRYMYLEGTIPVLVSAPHAVRETKDDYYKQPDTVTGGIALMLNELTGCHVIVKPYNDGIDPNHTNIGYDDEYKEKIIDIVKNSGIVLLLDLHGLKMERETDVDVITNYGKTVQHNESIISNISEYFKENGIMNITYDKYYHAKSEKVISHKISDICKIPCIEIEINGHYRNIDEEVKIFELINSLKDIIKNYKSVLK